MRFENEKCDGCNEVFKENDDIVTCPVCGTPQHRHCYEQAGGCVNAAKHASFEWRPTHSCENQDLDERKSEKTVCRRCGESNPKENSVCSTCGYPLRNEKGDERKESFSESPLGGLMGDELPELEEIIESRVRVLAPGITPEQRREQLCDHELGRTVSFVGNKAADYVKKFRLMEHGSKRTFNWAAFLFSPIWFFYRRLYKVGVVYLTLFISLSMFMTAPLEKFYSIYNGLAATLEQNPSATISAADQSALSSAMIPIMVIVLVTVVLKVIAGFTADSIYHKYCTQSLNELDFIERTADNVDSLKYYLKKSSTGYLATIISMTVYYILPSLLMSLFMQ